MTRKQRERKARAAAARAAMTDAERYDRMASACQARKEAEAEAEEEAETAVRRNFFGRQMNPDDGYAGYYAGVSRADIMGWDD